MTTVHFLSSVQGHQVDRVKEIAGKLREREPGVNVEVVEGERNVELLKKHKLQFGPAVVIDERLEFVGVPHMKLLVSRVAICQRRAQQGYPRNEPWKAEEGEKGGAPVVPLVKHPVAQTAPKEFQAGAPAPQQKPTAPQK